MNKSKIEDIKNILMIKLGENSNELLISIAIEEAIESIKNYCNIESVPDALSFTVVNIAIDIINSDSESISNRTVKSIARGDTNITYADKKVLSKGDIVKSYSKQLNNYKKVRWA